LNPKLEKGLGFLMRPQLAERLPDGRQVSERKLSGRINPELARDWFWGYNIFNQEVHMTNSSKFFVVIGCLLMVLAVILKVTGFVNPAVMRVIKPSSFLILANISFVLAILVKKS